MNTRTHLIQLEAWVSEEIAAQSRLRKVLEDQLEAIQAGKTPELTASGEAVEAELKRGPAREHKRQRLVRALAQEFGADSSALTISSIVERARAQKLPVDKLSALRGELRTVTAEVLKLGRSIKSMARYHQGLLADVMGLIVESGESNRGRECVADPFQANLVDAEA